MGKRLNIAALVSDLGGAAKTAEIAGVVRTAPYGWIRRHYISSEVLERIVAAKPDLDLNSYFHEVDDNDGEQIRRSS
jgi:hypothetical protein